MSSSAIYKGFETSLSALKLTANMIKIILYVLVTFQVTGLICGYCYFINKLELYILFKSAVSGFFSWVYPSYVMNFTLEGDVFRFTAGELYPYIVTQVLPVFPNLFFKIKLIFFSSFSVYLILPALLYIFKKQSIKQNRKTFVKGADIVDPETLNHMVKNKKPDLPFGEVKLPYEKEIQHTFFVGSPGTGKSVFLTQVVERVIKRNDPFIIYDYKGEYVEKFFRPGIDHIFNPVDARCLKWNIFNDIAKNFDIDTITNSLISPDGKVDDVFWYNAAQDVLSGIIYYLINKDKRTNKDLWETAILTLADLSTRLKNSKGSERGFVYIQSPDSRQAVSIHSVLMQHLKSFEYMQHIDGDFSLNDWVRNPQGNIYLTNYENVKDTLKPILSLFIDLMIIKLLSRDDNLDARTFLFLDEFGTLQRLPSIVNILTGGRSKGLACFLGIQDVGKIEKVYGKELRQTIVNACGNSIIFRVSDPQTASYLSDKIGQTIYKIPNESLSMGITDSRDGISITSSETTQPLVIPSELQNLENLQGYVKFTGMPISKVRFAYKPCERLNEKLLLSNATNIIANDIQDEDPENKEGMGEIQKELFRAGDRKKTVPVSIKKEAKKNEKTIEQDEFELPINEYDHEYEK